MKRITALLLILIFAITLTTILLPVATAQAESENYLLIDRENVSIYADTRKAPALFTLPKTYYVKVLEPNYDDTYHRVEYNGIVGLVKISEVSSKTESDVQDPYYTSQSISAHISTHLYRRPSFAEAEDSGIVAYGLSLTYLGKISGEKGSFGSSTWFAVLNAGEIYYIHSAMTENLDLLETDIPVHPNSTVQISTPENSEAGSEASQQPANKVDIVRILLIVGMCVPIVIILFVLFRPRRRRSRGRIDKEEDDY